MRDEINKSAEIKSSYLFKINFSLAAFLIILVISTIAYLPSFNSSFHLDDIDQIVNSNIRYLSPVDIIKIWPTSRLLVFLSFSANAKLHGYNVFGFHLVNFLIHVFNAFIIFKLTELLLYYARRTYPKSTIHLSTALISLFTALVFAVHPLQTQTVIYITQRLMLSASLFYLLAMYSIARGYMPGNSKAAGWISAAAFFIAGAFCKEVLVTLPVVIILLIWFLIQPPKFKLWTKKNWQ